MNIQLVICLIIFIATLASFVIGRFTMATTAMFSMLLLVITGCLDSKTALSGFSNSSTVIMASMFVVSAGFSKTQMVRKLSNVVGRVSKGSFIKVLAGYVLINALLGQFIQSSMACFSIVFPLAVAMCDDLGFSRSKMIFPIGMVSIACIGVLPIGPNAVSYITSNGQLASYGYTVYEFQMLDNMIARLPSLIFIVVYAIFVAHRFCPEKPVVAVSNVESKAVVSGGTLGPVQEVTGYVTFFGVVVLLLTQSLHGIPTWTVTVMGAVLMVASGILKPSEAYSSIGLGGMVLLYVGMLGVANALTATGAAQQIGGLIVKALGETANGYLVGLVFFMVPFVLTQFMMNVAVMNIFTPIAIITCQSLGINPIGPMILVSIGSLTAFMSPMATPTVPMIMGLGGYDQKALLKASLMPAVLMCLINVVWVMTAFPA